MSTGFGMCCGCGTGGGTASYVSCSIICDVTTYCTSLPCAYCFSIAGVGSTTCPTVGARYASMKMYYNSCILQSSSLYVHYNPDNPPGGGLDCSEPPDATPPAWGAEMYVQCSGTIGTYTLTEPMMVLHIHGDDVYTWHAYYAVAMASYGCSSGNTFDLVYEDATSAADFAFAATLSVTPCANYSGQTCP